MLPNIPHNMIGSVKCTSFSCCKTPTQHNTTDPVFYSWDVVPRLKTKFCPFFHWINEWSFGTKTWILVWAIKMKVLVLSNCNLVLASLQFAKTKTFILMTQVMTSSLLSGLSANVGTRHVTLWTITFSYQISRSSSHGVLLLFCGWFLFPNAVMAGYITMYGTYHNEAKQYNHLSNRVLVTFC